MPSDTQNRSESDLTFLIDRIVREEVVAAQERRSAHRTSLVRPVLVRMGNGECLDSFSKNISAKGIGLIMAKSLPAGTVASLTVHSLKEKPIAIHSELRWCEPFGENWFASGWNFIAVDYN